MANHNKKKKCQTMSRPQTYNGYCGRRKLLFFKYFVTRKKGVLVRLLFISTALSLAAAWFLADATSAALSTPVIYQDLHHFRRNRSLVNYLENIQLLIEPSTTECDKKSKIPLLVIVTSSPLRFENREAIRTTWGTHVPTYFIMGLNGPSLKELLVDNYVEAKMYSDLIIYDFSDHYQNLTLKTALMMKWTLDRCPHAEFLFKTDDDVLLNPWTMKIVLEQKRNAALIGYKKENTYLHRDEHNKWYLPRWLHYEDRIAQYLSGTGYLINGNYLRNISEAASRVPIINLEDVYLTYLVATNNLGLTLTHDSRLSPYKPWLPLACMYWRLASAHSLGPKEMINAWPGILALGEEYDKLDPSTSIDKPCTFYATYLSSDIFLF